MKKTMVMIIALLLAIGMVSAVIVTFYGQRTTTINVELPIEVHGDETNTLSGMGGTQVKGIELTIENKADFEIAVEITTSEETGVETTHMGILQLVTKEVDFTAEVWEVIAGDTATVAYTLDGDTFSAEVAEEDVMEGYVLIYYKDNSDRFTDPATAILVDSVNENLPYTGDGNADEYDYCDTGEYKTCHGAKIWYVPLDAITDGNLDWGRADEFLYESELIQYNNAGVITMYPDSELSFYPLFDLALNLDGSVVLTTTVDLFE